MHTCVCPPLAPGFGILPNEFGTGGSGLPSLVNAVLQEPKWNPVMWVWDCSASPFKQSSEVILRLSINGAEKQLTLIKLAEICATPCMCVVLARAVREDLFRLVLMADSEILGLSLHPARPPLFQMLPWWNLWVLFRRPDSGLRAGDDCCVRVIDRLRERGRRCEGVPNSLRFFCVALQRSGVDLSPD